MNATADHQRHRSAPTVGSDAESPPGADRATAAALCRAADGRTFIDRLLRLTDGRSLYVMSHDLSRLIPFGHRDGHEGGDGDRRRRSVEGVESTVGDIDDAAALAAMLAGRPYQSDNGVLVPLVDGRFPVGAVLVPDEGSARVSAELAGTVLDKRIKWFEWIDRKRRREQMSPAAQLQWDQLPVRAATFGSFSIGATLEPAFTVAGDLFDMATAPSGAPTVVSMDAMGHGTTATLSATLVLAAMRSARREGATLVEQVEAADEAILNEYDGDRFVTVVAVELSDEAVSVVNGGHEPMWRVSPGSSVEQLDLPADPPLGLEGRSRYRLHSLDPLAEGEILWLLSDGVVDARNRNGETFGSSGIRTALNSVDDEAPLQAASLLAQRVLDHVSDDLQDDLTSMVVQRLPADREERP